MSKFNAFRRRRYRYTRRQQNEDYPYDYQYQEIWAIKTKYFLYGLIFVVFLLAFVILYSSIFERLYS